MEVLYEWITTIQTEMFDVLLPENRLEINAKNTRRKLKIGKSLLVSEYATANEIIPILIEFDKTKKKQIFDSTIVSCEICLSDKRGAECRKLNCEHIFCQKCLSDFFSILITEGAVHNLKCPSCGVQVYPNIVKETVSPDLFERFDRLLVERCLETMEDIYYCPRPNCGNPCILLSREENTCMCDACQFCFCILCQRSSHGRAPCQVISGNVKKLMEEYNRAVEMNDREKIKAMQKQYGQNLKQFVDLQSTMNFIKENSMPCPKCNMAIQKSEGCNKMTCGFCGAFFCYLCGQIINKENPYTHFNSPKNSCFGLLFEGVENHGLDLDELLEDEEWF